MPKAWRILVLELELGSPRHRCAVEYAGSAGEHPGVQLWYQQQ